MLDSPLLLEAPSSSSIYRSHVLQRLVRIAPGFWVQEGNTVRLMPEDKSLKGLELWRTTSHKAGRIVFEVAVDYSQR